MADHTLCLTGGTGYIGRHLRALLAAQNVGLVLIGRPGIQAVAEHGTETGLLWEDPKDLAQTLAKLNNPVVINLAGHFVKSHTPSDINNIVAGNLTYPTQIFEACTLGGVTRLVNVGTSWEFSDKGAQEAFNLYAAVKAANAVVARWYAREAGLRIVNLKLNDTYGGEDTRLKLMPLLKKQAQAGTQVKLGFSGQRLNLLFIDDVLSGILAAVERTAHIDKGNVQETFLLADETVSLGDLVARIQSGPAPNLNVAFQSTAPEGATLRDVWDDAPRLTGWKPAVNLDDGLAHYLAPKDSA
jgi:nucleoside-diphosphate-sugar epimerase